jgi:cytidylate kinase
VPHPPAEPAAAPAEAIRPTKLVVAIDGPSGAGKSTVARLLATRLGARYLDTGAMYRAVTVRALADGVDVTDPAAVAKVVADVELEPGLDPTAPTMRLDGRDVTTDIRSAPVTQAVSAVSAVPEVRARLVAIQRDAIKAASAIVVEGRDIGTVVAPDATVKVFLTAAPDARAQRRNLELRSSPESVEATAQDLARRDELDSSRPVSPLTAAAHAVHLDTTDISADQAVDQILGLIAQAAPDRTAERAP